MLRRRALVAAKDAAKVLRPRACSATVRTFEDEVSLEVKDGVALLTLTSTSSSGTFAWGTKREEHRWNPVMVSALQAALDEVEAAEEVQALVVTNKGKFWSNGMDLNFLDSAEGSAGAHLGKSVNELLARVCCFPLPTVAAFSGHWCAAGGMMGLCFDYRVMASDSGFFFIPGIDLGLIYAPLQMALMKAKLPSSMHRDVILFNTRRWKGEDLLAQKVVDVAVPTSEVLTQALALAAELRSKGQGPARKALSGIKRGLYSEVLLALREGGDMGYDGRPRGLHSAAPPRTAKL